MIKVEKFTYGDYPQKLILDGNKIKDVECDCTWGKVHSKAWKKGETICHHLIDSIKDYNRTKKRLGNFDIKISKDKGRYIYLNGIAEHILVVEKFIGRFLTPEERIHHLDENKSNNKIENLMLFENNSKHISFHSKVTQFGFTRPIRRQIAERWNNA